MLVTSCGAGCVTLNVDDGSSQEFRFDGHNWVSAREFLPDSAQCYNDGHTVGVWNHWVIEPSFAHVYSVAEPVDCGDGLQPIDPAVFDLSRV